MLLKKTKLASPLLGAFDPQVQPFAVLREDVQPNTSLYSRLYDRVNPTANEDAYPLDYKQKDALFRRGLLSFAAAVSRPNGGNLANAVATGLLSGSNTMDQGADQLRESAYKRQLLDYKLKGGEDPSGYRQFEMMAAAAGLKPGTPEYQKAAQIGLGMEGRASNAGFSQVKFTDNNGLERIGVINGRTGEIDLPDGTSFNPKTGAYSNAPAQTQAGPKRDDMEADIALANDMVKAGFPPEKIDAFLAARGSRADAPMPASPPEMPTSPAGNVFVSRSPEETARAKAQAEAEVKLANQQELERRGALGGVQGKSQGELETAIAKRAQNAGNTLQLLDQAETLLKSSGATGSYGGSIYDRAMGAMGRSTSGAQVTAGLKAIAGQLTANVPRMEGPQSDRDVQLYREMAGNLADDTLPIQTRLAALRQIRALQQKYANVARPATGAPTAPRRLKFNPATGRLE